MHKYKVYRIEECGDGFLINELELKQKLDTVIRRMYDREKEMVEDLRYIAAILVLINNQYAIRNGVCYNRLLIPDSISRIKDLKKVKSSAGYNTVINSINCRLNSEQRDLDELKEILKLIDGLKKSEDESELIKICDSLQHKVNSYHIFK